MDKESNLMRNMGLKFKLIIYFLVANMLALLVINAIFMLSAVSYGKNRFISDMDYAVQNGFAQSVQSIMSSSSRDFVKRYRLEQLISESSGSLRLGGGRNCYVIDGVNGSVLASSDSPETALDTTPNLDAALSKHTKGASVSLTARYSDYAYYIMSGSDSDGYIIYIKDDNSALNSLLHNFIVISIWILVIGGILTVLYVTIVSRTITIPLKRLIKRAENFSKGRYDASVEPERGDEIGVLTQTFNNVGVVMSSSINQKVAEKHKVDVIMEHVTNGIMAFDTDQNLIHINSAAKRMLKIEGDTDDLKFDSFFESLHVDICMAEFMYLEKYATEIRDISIDMSHIRAYYVPFKMENERTAGVVCVFEDFTEQFNLEAARQKFVAEVSHELKTPLMIIKGYTETLLNGYMDDKKMATKFLNTINDETDKMNSLVRNLLDLSKFDVQKFEMKKEVVSLDKMLTSLVDMFKLEAEVENIELNYIRSTDIPQIYADKDQIERAVRNIISNAIKYGVSGGYVNIYAGSIYNEIYIKVVDNGKGMTEEELSHVFERFYRADTARTREKGGTGLGLSIAKEIIENHGGSITIESKFGEYTKVTIHLPMASGA